MDLDALKKIMAEKRAIVKSQGSVLCRGDLEKEREAQYLKSQAELNQKRELKKLENLKEDEENSHSNPYKKVKKEDKAFELLTTDEQEAVATKKAQDDIPPIPKEEVAKKLRAMGVPVTFFGETDSQRFKRLRRLEVDMDERKKISGDGNVFDKAYMMNDEDFKKKQLLEESELDEDKIAKLFAQLEEPQRQITVEDNGQDKSGNGGWPRGNQRDRGNKQKRNELDSDRVKSISYDSKRDDILTWSKKTLRDWEEKLDKRFQTEDERKSNQARKLIGSFRQTTEYLKPLFKLLSNSSCSAEILNGLYIIIHYSLKREYVKAHDKYLELAIGNAPWPMGVTMVGIHERAGRSKIFSSQVAHILNDETTRKYLQSMKRLVTIQQMLHPAADKAKMINFDTAWEDLF